MYQPNKPYNKVLPLDKELSVIIMASIPSIQGEMRTVEKCCDCGHFFGRRFVLYGIGHGASYDPCLCQITGHRPSLTVIELIP